MTKLVNTTGNYTTTPAVYAGVNAPITVWTHQNIAASQARVYEVLTNQDADGSGSTTTGNDAHNHTNDGSLPFYVLSSQSWGSEAWATGDAASLALGAGTQLPYTITDLLTATDATDVPALYWPVFIPTGLEGGTGRDLLLVIRSVGDPQMRATLATWAGGPPKTPTTVTGYGGVRLRGGGDHYIFRTWPDSDQIWWCKLHNAVAGLHTVQLTTSVHTASDGENRRMLKTMSLIVAPSTYSVPDVSKPELATANRVDVGDSRRSNAWTPPSDALYPGELTPTQWPIGPGVRFLALNDAWLQEKALGLPAAGQATMTVSAGHNHDGTAGNGAEIEIPLVSFPLGHWNNYTGTGIEPARNIAFFGNGAEAPTTTSDAYKQVLEFEIYTPAHTYASDSGTPGHERLYCAALMYSDASKTSACVTRVTTLGTTSVEYASDAATQGVELVTSSSGFNFTSGGRTKVEVEIKLAVAGGGAASLLGLCFWISPP